VFDQFSVGLCFQQWGVSRSFAHLAAIGHRRSIADRPDVVRFRELRIGDFDCDVRGIARGALRLLRFDCLSDRGIGWSRGFEQHRGSIERSSVAGFKSVAIERHVLGQVVWLATSVRS